MIIGHLDDVLSIISQVDSFHMQVTNQIIYRSFIYVHSNNGEKNMAVYLKVEIIYFMIYLSVIHPFTCMFSGHHIQKAISN